MINKLSSSESFDVIVVGGGHAGCESALTSARLGLNTALGEYWIIDTTAISNGSKKILQYSNTPTLHFANIKGDLLRKCLHTKSTTKHIFDEKSAIIHCSMPYQPLIKNNALWFIAAL